MANFYAQLMEKSGFDEALVCRALDFAEKVDIKEFSRLFFDVQNCIVEKTGVLYFHEAFYPFEFYGKLMGMDLPPETASLYLYISMLQTSFCDFSSRITDENIFFSTVKRICEGAKEYRIQKENDGLYEYRFLANHVRGNILRLGGFEYQYGHFEDKKCIVLHLPENADISKENRLCSYSLARRYFGEYPIIGDSWLLYPEHKKMLPEDSRIVDFMNDFDLISANETVDYSELFHVFGRLSDYSYENLPKETSLQKAYAERVKIGLAVGSGVGRLKY